MSPITPAEPAIHDTFHRVPDLALPVQHPKRSFIQRAVEYEIRLSYHDRILKTLPEAMHGLDVSIIPEQAPGPDFEYDDPCMCFSAISCGVVHLKRRCNRQPLS